MDARTAIGFLARMGVASIVASSFAVLLLIGILPRTGLYRTMTVLSGSMEPTFAPGDIVLARPTSADTVQVGDILVYQVPVGAHQVESHRIIQILGRRPLLVRTKGDANEAADPWTASLDGNRVWTVRKSVPWAGKAIIFLRSPNAHKITTYLLPALVAMLFLSTIWRRPEEADGLIDANVVPRA
jgi:signal peptidase I